MPKIIKNLREKLIEETGRQLSEGGIESITIRSVAKNCGVGTGTVYNYFNNKNAMISAYILQDWDSSIARIEQAATAPKETTFAIYTELNSFMIKYRSLFSRISDQEKLVPRSYHQKLKSQLGDILCRFTNDRFCAEFIAEALITWSVSGIPFDQLYRMLEKLF